MKAHIWRIENQEGIGCYRFYRDYDFIERMELRHNADGERPTPYRDKGIDRYMERGEICGFKDLPQAKNWFSQYELRKLAKLGFELKEVEVLKVTAIGEKQVLAIR